MAVLTRNMNILWFFQFIVSAAEGCLVEVNGIEPMTSCVQGRRSPS